VATFAGSGREARQDGSLRDAGFAQPSGLTTDGRQLYSADSEANIIRAIDLSRGEVQTLVGGDLFDFGDVDGKGDSVRLQHPLGLALWGDKILIADTYNHKIKLLDPQARKVRTFAGTGKPGQTDGKSPKFYEPGGLSVAGDKLYVADTNNHAIRVVDLRTQETSTLRIKGLQPPTSLMADETSDPGVAPNAEETRTQPQHLRVGSEAALVIDVELPDGYHLNPSAPQRYQIAIESGAEHLSLAKVSATDMKAGKEEHLTATLKDPKLPVRVPLFPGSPGEVELRASFTFVYCREDNTGTCRIKTLIWRVPVDLVQEGTAPQEVRLEARVQ
jgi:hypothetical protein